MTRVPPVSNFKFGVRTFAYVASSTQPCPSSCCLYGFFSCPMFFHRVVPPHLHPRPLVLPPWGPAFLGYLQGPQWVAVVSVTTLLAPLLFFQPPSQAWLWTLMEPCMYLTGATTVFEG
jgi:hypothetical protein